MDVIENTFANLASCIGFVSKPYEAEEKAVGNDRCFIAWSGEDKRHKVTRDVKPLDIGTFLACL